MFGLKCYESSCMIAIPFWDILCLNLNGLLWGTWLFLKRLIRWSWNPKGFFYIQPRDNPPPCLVDSNLGHHSYMKLKGVKLHYVESGAKDNPLVLLLHGFPDCWFGWRYQIPELAKYFHVIAIDLKGFGDSDKPSNRGSYRPVRIVSEIQQFIKSLGESSCILIGHDIGALIGWYLIHESPDLIRKFVSISGPHPNVYWDSLIESSTFNSQWIQAIQLPYLPEIDALKEDINVINAHFSHLTVDQKKTKNKSDAFIEAYKYAFSRIEDWRGPLNYYRTFPIFRIKKECNQTEVPTLLIIGNKDPSIKLESMIKSSDYCQRFFVKVIENGGHFPHQEYPHELNMILLSFLVVRELKEIEQQHSEQQQNLLIASSKNIMDRMFGAVSNTVKYGNSVLDVVQKKTNGVVQNAPRALFLAQKD